MRAVSVFLALGCATAPRGAGPAAGPGPAAKEDPRLSSLLSEAIRFPTVAGNDQAQRDQQAWLLRTAASLGLTAHDAGPVTEIELLGPPGAPVLGLVVHGDVQPVDAAQWTVPPFEGLVRDGFVIGRGAADDKGPLVQALLAMEGLRGAKLTHTVRLLVGSDEESGSSDVKAYLAAHAPPAYSLVLDSEFPVVVGEKAWDGLAVLPASEECAGIAEIDAGLAPSIVPDRARLTLRGDTSALRRRLAGKTPDQGTRLEVQQRGDLLDVVVQGKSAHAGVNLGGGRNALVSLARLLQGELPDCAVADLFAFIAAQDTRGAALGLTEAEPGWGGWAVNVATLRKEPRLGGKLALIINLRRPPPMNAIQSRDTSTRRCGSSRRASSPGPSFLATSRSASTRGGSWCSA